MKAGRIVEPRSPASWFGAVVKGVVLVVDLGYPTVKIMAAGNAVER